MSGVRAILANPKIYELWSRLVGGRSGRATLVAEHVRPRRGARVLDLGCGPGELLRHLAGVSYVGVDASDDYIAQARRVFGDRAEFRVGDATRLDDDLRDFDVVLAFGVLQHLDDAAARRLLDSAAAALSPDGRFVSVDPTLVPDQSRLARFVVARDRGDHVRAPGEYRRLGESVLGHVHVRVRSDLLRIPYTHCILEARRP